MTERFTSLKRITRIALLASCSTAALEGASAAHSAVSVVTQIVPDTVAGVSTGTTVSSTGTMYTINGGTLKGSNLFESFTAFSLASGNTASWTYSAGNPAAIYNVINRVTGGRPSNINGTISSSEMPNANFYFINPAGIMFGAGASVNVPAAAHFSTAQNLKFSDGATFSASTPTGSTLTIANPTAFGFLGGQKNITVKGVGPNFSQPGATLSLSAANINVSNSTITAGEVDMAAVGNQAIAIPTTNLPATNTLHGELTISGSSISTTPGTDATGAIAISGGNVDISSTTGNTLSSATAPGGFIQINAQTLEFDSDSHFKTETAFAQNAGGVSVNVTGNAMVSTNSDFRSVSDVASSGNAGQVDFDVGGNLSFLNASGISTDTDGFGNTEGINISAKNLVVGGNNSAIASDTFASGNAGTVIINVADDLTVRNSGFIESATRDIDDPAHSGNAGVINITAGNILIDGDGYEPNVPPDTYITTNTIQGTGNAGQINLSVSGNLTILNYGAVEATTRFTGNAGNISINAGNILLNSDALLATDTSASGAAGKINLNVAGDLTVLDGATIESSTSGSGNAGDVTLSSGNLSLNYGGLIATDTYSSGNAGDVAVTANSLLINNESLISSSTLGSGGGGQVTIAVPGSLTIANGGSILALTSGTGAGGKITVQGGGNVFIQTDGSIDTDTFGAGVGGDIKINASNLFIDGGADNIAGVSSNSASDKHEGLVGKGNAGNITIDVTNDITLENGGVVGTDAEDKLGSAGDIEVTAENLLIDGGSATFSYISSSTLGTGTAGHITLNVPGDLTISDGGFIDTDTLGLSHGGDAGDIIINAGNLRIDGSSPGNTYVSSESYGSGAGGNVTIVANNIDVGSLGEVSSSALGSGSAGNLTIDTSNIALQSGGLIETNSSNANTSGTIVIKASDILVDGAGSEISSVNSSAQGGAAGDITILADPITLSNGGAITTNSLTGVAGGISFTFSNGGYLLLVGATTPGEITTSSGAESGGHINIDGPGAIILDGGEIQALGPGNAADVAIDSPGIIESADRSNQIAVAGTLDLESQVIDVSSSLVLNNLGFADASKILAGRCPEHELRGETSHYNHLPIGPYARVGGGIFRSGGAVADSRRDPAATMLACSQPWQSLQW